MILWVRDAFASSDEVSAALEAWPVHGWHSYGAHKRVTVPGTHLPVPISELLHRMAALKIGWIPDLGLWGAGLHEMFPNHELGWHSDAERHPSLNFSRARSGVLYLCGDGELEFRDGAIVRPAPGRLVVFDGSAVHRVSKVSQLRRSITLFWYGPTTEAGATRSLFEDNP